MADNKAFDNNELGIKDPSSSSSKSSPAPTTSDEILYKIDSVPPWYLCIFLGLQHYLTMFGSAVSIPFLICPALCIQDNDPARGYIISTIFFVSGIVTLIQATFGVRLPIVQGGSFSFLVPTFAILSLPHFKCPAGWDSKDPANATAACLRDNSTRWLTAGGEESGEGCMEEMWQVRMREIQGAIIVASFFQFFIGYFGLIGLMLRFITPLTIAPAVAMITLPLFDTAAFFAAKHWGISILTIVIMTVFSQYIRNVPVPCLGYSEGRLRRSSFYVFKLFPVLLTILAAWGFCAILTVQEVFPAASPGRTDTKLDLVARADWFRFPYPFQWGLPTVSLGGVFGMLAGVLAGAIESVGDYYACARLAGAPPPPTHAINRGIGTEGLGCILAGIWGTGSGTTSYSENIGAIGVTKVGSRRVIQYGAIIMIIFGLFSKFGAFFLTIPEPILGGIFCVMFGMITAVGLSSLQFVDLNSTRNLFVLGFSMFFSLVLPTWLKNNKDVELFGIVELDQIIKVLLSTSMFVAGFLGFFLDNTIPGSREERGLIKWENQHKNDSGTCGLNTYDLPWGMDYLNKQNWARYIPFLPTFDDSKLTCSKKSAA